MQKNFPWSFRLATAEEACQYLRISLHTLYRLLENGRLTGYKVGGTWRFRPEDMESYLTLVKSQPGRFFYATVLQKYFVQPKKYKITQKGDTGWLALQRKYLVELPEGKRKKESFDRVRYQKVRWKKATNAIMVMPRYFARLPQKEQQYWKRFEISGIPI